MDAMKASDDGTKAFVDTMKAFAGG